jgi:ABC-type sulfate/molybdate transport systems ATPase subunit
MSIPIGTKMLTKPPKQKSKTHLKNHTFRKKKNLHKTLLISTMNNDLCISQTYSHDNVKTSRLHDTHIVMNKGEINTGESNENENVHKFNESVVSKNCSFKVKFLPF